MTSQSLVTGDNTELRMADICDAIAGATEDVLEILRGMPETERCAVGERA